MGIRSRLTKALLVPLTLGALATGTSGSDCTQEVIYRTAKEKIGATIIEHKGPGRETERIKLSILSEPKGNGVFALEATQTGYAVFERALAPGDYLEFISATPDVAYSVREWSENSLEDFELSYEESRAIEQSLVHARDSSNTMFNVIAQKPSEKYCDDQPLAYVIPMKISFSGAGEAHTDSRDSRRAQETAPKSDASVVQGGSDLERRLESNEKKLDEIYTLLKGESAHYDSCLAGSGTVSSSLADSIGAYSQRIRETERELEKLREGRDRLFDQAEHDIRSDYDAQKREAEGKINAAERDLRELRERHDEALEAIGRDRGKPGKHSEERDKRVDGRYRRHDTDSYRVPLLPNQPLRLSVSFGQSSMYRDESRPDQENWQELSRLVVRAQGERVLPTWRAGAAFDYSPGTGINVRDDRENASELKLRSHQLMVYGDNQLNIDRDIPVGLSGSMRLLWGGAKISSENVGPYGTYAEFGDVTTNEFAGLGSIGLGVGYLDRGFHAEARIGGMLCLASQKDRVRAESRGMYSWWNPWDYGWLIWHDTEITIREQHTHSLKPFVEGRVRYDGPSWGVEATGFITGIGQRQEEGTARGVHGEVWLPIARGERGRLDLSVHGGYERVKTGIPAITDANLEAVTLGIGLKARLDPAR